MSDYKDWDEDAKKRQTGGVTDGAQGITVNKRPEPRIGLINTLLENISDLFESKATPTNEEMALIALTLLRTMQERGTAAKVDFPNKMAIQSPTGWVFSFEVKRPVIDDGAPQLPIIGMKGN